MNRHIKLIAFCALAIACTSWPALASEGCSAFRGMATDSTKGPSGNRVGAGFSKGDTLVITRSDAPGMLKPSINLLEYGSPSGPSRAITEATSDSFTYTVPANTRDFIYLNLGSVNKDMIVTWTCAPAPQK